VRRYFRVDAESIVIAALDQLARAGAVDPETVAEARARYGWQG
jgi:pyruvate dehydrogenase E1 component